MGVDQVPDALRRALAVLPGARVHDVWPDAFEIPAGGVLCAVFGPVAGSGTEQDLAGCSVAHFFEITVAANAGNGSEQAQRVLRPYLAEQGAKSVAAAIRAQKTLFGTVQAVLYRGMQDYGDMNTVNDERVFGFTQRWEVVT